MYTLGQTFYLDCSLTVTTRPLLNEVLSMLDANKVRELELTKKVNRIQSTLDTRIVQELEIHKMISSVELALQSKDPPRTEISNFLSCLPISTPLPQPPNHGGDAYIQQWETTESTYLGIQVCLIASKFRGNNKYNLSLRWPLIGWKVLNGRVSSTWSSWYTPSFRPCFRVQNVVPTDSEVVKASCNNDPSKLNELLLSGAAHPNDTTEDNLTLLYVSNVHCVITQRTQ
jgi:hypothetical protein